MAHIIHCPGSQASIADMLGKLAYVYGIVTSFDVLMQSLIGYSTIVVHVCQPLSPYLRVLYAIPG